MEHKPLYTLTFEPTRADYRKFFYWASLKRTGQAITKALLLALVISLVAVILLQTPNILFFLLVYAAVLLLLCGVFAVGVEAQAAKRLRADRSGAHPGPKTLYLCRSRAEKRTWAFPNSSGYTTAGIFTPSISITRRCT